MPLRLSIALKNTSSCHVSKAMLFLSSTRPLTNGASNVVNHQPRNTAQSVHFQSDSRALEKDENHAEIQSNESRGATLQGGVLSETSCQ